MKILLFLITISVLLACSSSQNEPVINPEKISEDEVWMEGSSAQGYSGATAVMDLESVDSEEFPLERLFKFLDSKSYVSDSNRIKKLAHYAYTDIRKETFKSKNGMPYVSFNKENHSFGSNNILIWGEGYFFAKKDSTNKFVGPDLAIEFWEIDTTIQQDVDKLINSWKSKFHPMPTYLLTDKEWLYVLQTRSIQFAPFWNECKDVLINSTTNNYETTHE